MAFTLPKLKFAYDALEPYLSKELVTVHYDKHTKKYFDTTNETIKGTIFEKCETLDELITHKHLKKGSMLYNNAMQAWNHQFYWNCLTPKSESGKPSEKLREEISKAGGSYNKFIEHFNDGAAKHFGSGWNWIVWRGEAINSFATHDADNPLLADDSGFPLLTIDVWEHAYYLDYKNDRAKYLDDIWNIINWEFVDEQYRRATRKDDK
jgi:Fe-Mn family superoxide dismutase